MESRRREGKNQEKYQVIPAKEPDTTLHLIVHYIMTDLSEIINLRHTIHNHPCLSGNEGETAKVIIDFLKKCKPDELVTNVAGYGIIAHYKGKKPGRSLLVRCELDALPITEKSGVPYSSKYNGIAHSCGHDGHMAILCGVAKTLAESRDKKSNNAKEFGDLLDKGDIYLLFQEEEEIGTGAKKMVAELKKKRMKFDYTLGLHNSPGHKEHQIVLFNKTYAWASTGMEILINGHTSHAGNPQDAANPTDAVIKLIDSIRKLDTTDAFSTIVNFTVGTKDYGITPGNGAVRITARANEDAKLKRLTASIEKCAKKIIEAENIKFAKTHKSKTGKSAAKNAFKYSISYSDAFPATLNNLPFTALVEKVVKNLGYSTKRDPIGEHGSDDYTYFTHNTKATFFNMGAGEKHAPIHTPGFDFDDNLIADGIKIICSVYRQIQQTQ